MADVDIETSREQRPPRYRIFSALHNVNFRYLWVSSAFISAGNQVQQIAMGLLVWEATNSTFWVGTVLGIRALPILVVGPLAGVAVDRLDRKKAVPGGPAGAGGDGFLLRPGCVFAS